MSEDLPQSVRIRATLGHKALSLLASEREERAHALVTQIKSSPNQHPGNDWAEKWLANTQVGRGSAAEVRGNQNRAENGSLRDQIDDSADQLENSQLENQGFRNSKLREAFDNLRRFH
jgi:hypothetical protein